MKTMYSMMAVFIVCLAVGCTTTFRPWNLSEVQEGMERTQVVGILGEPDYSVSKADAEYLYYSYREEMTPVADVSLETAEGIERRVAEFERTIREYKYEVILVDGKVINYKELMD